MGLLPDYKEITELLKKGLTLEAQEKIMELRVGAIELQEENIKLRERLKQLESEASLAKDLSFERGVYWMRKDPSRQGPYCSVCYDDKKKLIRLHSGRDNSEGHFWICLVCNNGYGG